VTKPTSEDIRNAETRHAIAEQQNAEYREAQSLALSALGPGWTPWMKLVLIDSDHRRTGNTQPVATVYKVHPGEKRLTENSVFVRRMPDGRVERANCYETLFGDLLKEAHPSRTVEVRGEQVPVRKYELCWSSLDLYRPRSPEALAAARENGEDRAVEKEAVSTPLFAEQIRAEGPARKQIR